MNSALDFPIQAQSELYPVGWSRLGAPHLLSLDVIIHQCDEFYRVCADLADGATWLSKVSPPDKLLDAEDAAFFHLAIEGAWNLLAYLGIQDSGGFSYDVKQILDEVRSLRGGVWAGLFDVRADMLARDFARIREGIFRELKNHKFLYCPESGAKYVNQERLFGDAVYEAFPSARYDIREAGNALAVEMYTACAFHLMRVTELGMRALATDRSVVLTTKGGNPYPFDMATWEQVLSGLSHALEVIDSWDRSLGTIKVQALGFYTSAVEEIRAMKGWRNDIMHTRREYISEDASQIMVHVKRLMVTLSGRISETERTPTVWTEAQLR